MNNGRMSENWCTGFFDDAFADLYLARGEAEVVPAVSFLKDKLRLAPGASVFDQCCGIGTLSVALAAEGYRVTGVDLIPSYVARAADAAEGLDCRFFTQDARSFIAPEPADAGFNWWTSFGYYEEDAENLRMLQAANRSLKTGAYFALDYMNRDERLNSFAANDVRESVTPQGTWTTAYDRARDMVVKTWRYDAEGSRVEKKGGGVKLYSAACLERLLTAAGFGDIEFYGDWQGAPLTASSPRCIAVARKISAGGDAT
jgi:SAM-dependent methyltransferase